MEQVGEHLEVAQEDVEEEQVSGEAQVDQVDEGEKGREAEVDLAVVVVDLEGGHSLELEVGDQEEVDPAEADQRVVQETELVVVDGHHD